LALDYWRAHTKHVCSTNCSKRAFRLQLKSGFRSFIVGVRLEIGYRMDLVVEGLVIVEIKSVDAISPIHQAQIISYLKLSSKSLGLLINFNVVHLKDGIRRFVNGSSWKEEQTLNH